MNWIHLIQDMDSSYFEHDNELFGSRKSAWCLDYLSHYKFLKNHLSP
jgi:hypothetical protein